MNTPAFFPTGRRSIGNLEAQRVPLSVVLIEDNPGDARLFEELLDEGELAADCRWESSLESGLRTATSERPDILAVDLDLPDSSGLQTVRRVRDAVPDVPLVVTTGLEDLDTATEALEVGASEYLRKDGLTPELLARTLRMALERHRLQREADRQRQLSRSILESLPEHIAVLDAEGRILATNEAWREFAEAQDGDPRGYVGESYLGETEAAAAKGSGDAEQMLEGLQAVLGGRRDHFEMEYPCHGPEEKRWFRVSVVPLEGEPESGVVVSHINITERKLAEQDLLRIQAKHVRAQKMAHLGHWEMDLTTGAFERSDEVRQILALEEDLAPEAGAFLDRIHPDDHDRLRSAFEAIVAGESSSFDEMVRVVRPGGEVRWIHDRAERKGDRITGTIQDVTERVERERELEQTTSALQERIKEQSCLHDVSQLLHADERDVDERLQELVERLPDGWQHPEVTAARLQLRGEEWSTAGFTETGRSLSAPVTAGGERIGHLEVRYLEERPEEDLGPFLEEEERLIEAIAAQIAVTVERRDSRRELEAERQRLIEVFENAPAWVAVLRGPEHVFEMANPAYFELVGDREVIERPVREVFPELEGEGYFELLDHVYESGETVEVEERPLRLETPDGTDRRYITFVYQPRREGGEISGIIAHGVDVTEQVEEREAAREAEEKWATALDLAPIGIAISHPETGEYHSVNRACAEMVGLEPEEIVGRTAHDIGFWHDADRREEFLAELREKGWVRNELMQFETGGGEVRAGRLSVNALELAGEQRLIWTLQDVTEKHEQRERLHLLESAVEATDLGLIITERQGEIAYANPAFREMTGYSAEEVLGETPRILKSGEQDEAFYEELWDTILAGRNWEGEIVNRRKDGSLYVEQQHIVPVRHRSDEITHFIALKRDVTAEKRRAEALRESETRYRTLVETMAEATVILGRTGRITFANSEAEELLGLQASEIAGRTYDDPAWRITDGEGRPLPDDQLPFRRVMDTGRPVRNVEHAVEQPDGERRILSVNAAPLTDGSEEPRAVVATMRDVTERKRMEGELRHRALHDPLTELANRSLFHDRLEQALARARRHGETVGVLILDLDRFKQVNDHLGHAAGDRLLEEAARRMEDAVRDEDTVARMGGDEFAVVLPTVRGEQELTSVQERIADAVIRPYTVLGEQVEIDLTTGGILACDCDLSEAIDPGQAGDVLRYADLALYRAKERAGTSFHLFRPAEDRGRTRQLGREQELRRAIREGSFTMVYQPIVGLTGKVWGLEPLARWQHPERGLVSPGEFIPLAEETGLIHELGESLLRETCRQVASWSEETRRSLTITFNLSGRQFDREDLVPTLISVLGDHGIESSRFEWEVTETAVTRATDRVRELRDEGFGIVIDDFGTGFSSFHYLRDLEFDGLKIDMSFVHGIEADNTNRALVETMITLGRAMGMTVVAEGIETETQRDVLEALGCPLGQGYLFARPMPGEEVPGFLNGRRGERPME